MYAIVDIAGQQFKVQKDSKLYVHRLANEEGQEVEFDKVLLLENEGKIDVGTPFVDGVRVAVTVLQHVKGDKVHVFKKKRRKGYQKLNNHRQQLTQVQVEEILEKGKSRTASDKKVVTKSAAKPKVRPEEPVDEAAVPAKPKTTRKKAVKE